MTLLNKNGFFMVWNNDDDELIDAGTTTAFFFIEDGKSPTFTYEIDEDFSGDEELPYVTNSPEALDTHYDRSSSFSGAPTKPVYGFHEIALGVLNWDDDGTDRATTVVAFELYGDEDPDLDDGLDYLSFYRLGGDALPDISSLEQMLDFSDVAVFSVGPVTSGPLAPGETIDLSDLPGFSESDGIFAELAGDGGSLEGTDQGDALIGGDGEDRLEGFDGDDILEGEDSRDELYGGDGDDMLRGGVGNDYINAGDGDDFIQAQDDVEDGDWGDYIQPGLGADTIIGSEVLYNEHGDGIDISYNNLSGVGGITLVVDENGSGTAVSGTAGLVDDTFTYAHYFTGSQDDDVLDGSATDHGNGWTGHEGNDTLIGGTGWDKISYRNEQNREGPVDGVTVNFDTGTATDTFGDTDTFSGMDAVDGTRGDDTLIGSNDTDNIDYRGFAGDDTIIGSQDGYDLLDYRGDQDEGGTQGIIADLVAGTVKDGFGDTDTVSHIDDVRGTNFEDTITLGDDGARARGYDGDDTLTGGDGRDNLRGGDGNDTIRGGQGSDQIRGGDGDDYIDASDDNIEGSWGDFINPGRGSNTIIGSSVLYNDFGEGIEIYYDELQGIGGLTFTVNNDGTGTVVSGDDGEVDDTFTYAIAFGGTGDDDTFNGSDFENFEGWTGFAGDDTFDGAGGYDRLIYRREEWSDDAFQGVTVDFSTGTATDAFGDSDTFSNMEGVEGTYWDDVIIGSDDQEYIHVRSLGGNDTIQGAVDGYDSLDYRRDASRGGEGAISVDLTAGTIIDGFGDTDTVSNIDRVRGTEGNDSFILDDSGVRIDGEGGDDTATGGAGDDEFHDGAGNDVFNGGGGDDRFYLNTGEDTMNGGEGSDTVIVDLSNLEPQSIVVEVNLATGDTGGKGIDTLRDTLISIENYELTGDFDVELVGSGAANYLVTSDGTDNIRAGAGNDEVRGGNGDDEIDGQGGSDTLYGQAGNDTLIGGFADDLLFGGAGDDTLEGGDSTDQLFGNAGADVMDGGNSSDSYFVDGDDTVNDTGTGGYDKAQINNTEGETLDLADWSGLERVNGFSGDDSIDASSQTTAMLLFGAGGDDTLLAGSGDDALIGGDGDDVISGGAGNDLMLGNAGDDTFDGGAGSDTMFIGDSGDVITDGGEGFDKAVITETGGLSIDIGTWAGVERINGLTGDDVIDATGLETSMIFAGAGGGDVMTGGAAGDTMYGGQGGDTLLGAGGNDALIGAAGDDTIDGGAGNDFYLGGAGADTFAFSDAFEKDVVKDFTDGTDMLDFSGHSGVGDIGDLDIAQSGSNTIITLAAGGTDRVTLADVTATDLTDADFVFV